MKIIIFSDSLGRPRPDICSTESTRINEVYGEIVREYLSGKFDVELIYVESLDSEDAIHWGKRMVAFREPDVVFFHFGINDCAPRLFKKHGFNILLNDIFRKITFDIFLKLMSKFRYVITKYREIRFVSSDKFVENITTLEREILKYNSSCEFFFLGISGDDRMDKKSYGYNLSVEEYNICLRNKYEKKFIDVNEIASKYGLISDCVHLSKESHAALAMKIIDLLEK